MPSSSTSKVPNTLVSRNVQTANVALNASNSEDVDFLIYDIGGEKHVDGIVKSVFENVKIPIFVVFALCGEDTFTEASNLLKLVASGLVISLEVLELFGDVIVRSLFNIVHMNKRTQEKVESSIKHKLLNVNNSVYGKRRGC